MPIFGQTKRSRDRQSNFRAAKRAAHILPDMGTYTNRKSSATMGTQTEAIRPSGGVLTFRSKKTGRRESEFKKMMKLMKANQQIFVDRWQRLSDPSDSSMSFNLSHVNSDAVTNNVGTSTFPVYLFELNALNQNVVGNRGGSGVSTVLSSPMMQLARLDDATQDRFITQPLTGRGFDDTTDAYGWTFEEQTNSAVSIPVPIDRAYLDWVDLRIALMGARKYPSNVRIQIVRFTDEFAQPAVWTTLTSTTLPTTGNNSANPRATADWGTITPAISSNFDEWNSHWVQYTAPLISHPLNVRKKTSKSIWKVLHSKTFTFQPRDTSDDAPTGGVGDQVMFKWFNRIAKQYRYVQSGDNLDPTPDESHLPNEWGQLDSDRRDTHARPLARLFVVISGWSPGNFNPSVPADNVPAFDILVRRKWTYPSN